MLEDLFQSTELHEAVREGDIDRVRHLLREGAAVNAKAFFGTTPLMDACATDTAKLRQGMQAVSRSITSATSPIFAPQNTDPKRIDLKNMPRLDPKRILAEMNKKREPDDTLPEDDPAIALLLLEHGADVNAVDQSGHSPLMKAVMAGRTETARVLLEHGADFRAQDNDHLTPLLLASQARRLESVQLLLAWGADVDYRTPHGGTTLMAAADGGRVAIAQLLLTRDQNVNTVSANGHTALLCAALSGHADMVTFLKHAGATIGFLEAIVLEDLEAALRMPVPSPSERHSQWGAAVLLWAVKQGRADLIPLLTERGIAANAINKAGQPVLMRAVMGGDLACTRALLDAGADPNGTAGGRSTPLRWAGTHGYEEIVNLLLERGANPNATTEEGATNLSGAVMFGNLETARRLLTAGADPNGSVSGGTSLLTFATVRDDINMVRLLLEHGASAKKKGDGIYAAAMARDKPEIAALLKQAAGIDLHERAKQGKTGELLAQLDAGADINALGEMNETLLIAALRGKQAETARTLIKRGVNIHAADRIGQTALICAAARGDGDMTRLLLECGADVTVADEWGKTALLYAALANNQEIVALLIGAGAKVGPVESAILGDLSGLRMLLNGGADVDTRTPGGMTPLMGASAGGHLEIITALLIRRADLHATDEEGKTALAWAVLYKRLDAARLLLEQGADVNASGADHHHARLMADIARRHNRGASELSKLAETEKGRRGATPLGLAAYHEDATIATLLLAWGADINAPTSLTRHTPLTSAAMAGQAEMVRFLLEQGADATLADDRGYTALSLAEQFGKNPEVVEILQRYVVAR